MHCDGEDLERVEELSKREGSRRARGGLDGQTHVAQDEEVPPDANADDAAQSCQCCGLRTLCERLTLRRAEVGAKGQCGEHGTARGEQRARTDGDDILPYVAHHLSVLDLTAESHRRQRQRRTERDGLVVRRLESVKLLLVRVPRVAHGRRARGGRPRSLRLGLRRGRDRCARGLVGGRRRVEGLRAGAGTRATGEAETREARQRGASRVSARQGNSRRGQRTMVRYDGPGTVSVEAPL